MRTTNPAKCGGLDTTGEIKISGGSGAPKQVIASQGPGVPPLFTNPSDLGVDYGLSFTGTVTGIAGAPNFQCSNLVGFGNDYFKGYWAYVVWDTGGVAPQGEKLVCSGYVSATGDFTVAAFTVPIAVGDKVLLIHPSIAYMLGLTTARAGYLDELAAANIPADVDTLKASHARQLFSVDYWSVPQLSVVVPAGAANQAMPDVVVAAIPAGATVVKATPMFKFRSVTNAGAANKLNGAQHIQIQKGGAGGYADAISLIDDQFTIAAATVDAPGDVVIGDHNVVAKVDGNATYNFQWTSANADVAGLTFNDVQTGLRVWYSV